MEKNAFLAILLVSIHSLMEQLADQNVHLERMVTGTKESACRVSHHAIVAGLGQVIVTLVISRILKARNTFKRASAKKNVILGGLCLRASLISLVKNAVKIVELVKEGLITALSARRQMIPRTLTREYTSAIRIALVILNVLLDLQLKAKSITCTVIRVQINAKRA